MSIGSAPKVGLPSGGALVQADASPASLRPKMRGAPPLFVHSSFRTGSTWLWQKLRNAPTTFCYCEIFHEGLVGMTVDIARSVDHASWHSRHPLGAPYFLEFVPRITEVGVVGFEGSMAYEGIIPAAGPDGPLRPEERSYVEGLVDLAQSTRRIPVLTCTRSLGRARALRAAFGGSTIFLHRNLFHQWASYCSLAEGGNTYFVDTIVKTVLACAHDPFLRKVANWFKLAQNTPTPETLFQVFILLHLYLYSIAYDAADLVVDYTAISTDRVARRDLESQLSGMAGHAIDLSDAREECAFTTFTDQSQQVVRDVVEQFVKLIPAGSMTLEASAFVQQAMDRCLAEWDRFEFFNRRMRSILTTKIETASEAQRAAAAAAADAKEANDKLLGELSMLREESAQQGDIVSALADEERRMRDTLSAAVVESDACRQHASKAEHELDDARSQIGAITAERDAALASVAETRAERDSALATVAETAAEQATLREGLASAARDRDALQHALEEARSRGIISFLKRVRRRFPTRSP